MSMLDIRARWTRVGAMFATRASTQRLDIEDLLMQTAVSAPSDYRLFMVAASWLAVHHNLINARRFGRKLEELDDVPSAVAGAMLAIALEATPTSTQFRSAMRHCRPLNTPRPLFDTMAQHVVLLNKVKEDALPLFLKWGLWQDEVSLKMNAIRPVSWIVANCPELRIRALLGANLEAEILDTVLQHGATAAELARVLGATYAAVHDAASRLVGRGFVKRTRAGRRQVLSVPDEIAEWLARFPTTPLPTKAA